MSAFLGPIHYWLFKKIQLQNEITNKIIEAFGSELDLSHILKEKHGELENQPLESIIDEGNIHGWLQERVSLVEVRLADAVTSILKIDVLSLCGIKKVFFEFGKENKPDHVADAQEFYKFFNDILLDGMPCDRANELIEENADGVTWKRNICTHEKYWNEGDTKHYYLLRDSLIRGALDDSDFEYEELANNTYTIRRRA